MDTDLMLLDCQIHLTPKWFANIPLITIRFEEETVYTGDLIRPSVFSIQRNLLPGSYSVSIDFLNKTDKDTVLEKDLDMAVVIDRIEFNKISKPKFVWEGEYRPIYNPEWVEQQTVVPSAVLKNINYLGWNGTWRLNFTVPIFTWIHKTLNYGWIYD